MCHDSMRIFFSFFSDVKLYFVVGSWLMVRDVGFILNSKGFRVQGPGSRVQGSGFRVRV